MGNAEQRTTDRRQQPTNLLDSLLEDVDPDVTLGPDLPQTLGRSSALTVFVDEDQTPDPTKSSRPPAKLPQPQKSPAEKIKHPNYISRAASMNTVIVNPETIESPPQFVIPLPMEPPSRLFFLHFLSLVTHFFSGIIILILQKYNQRKILLELRVDQKDVTVLHLVM